MQIIRRRRARPAQRVRRRQGETLAQNIARQDDALRALLNDDALRREIAEQDARILDAIAEQDTALVRELGG